MARDKLRIFLWYEFLVNFFFLFLAHEVGRNHGHVDCLRIKKSKTHTRPETEEGSHCCCPSTKPSGWGTTLSPRHTTCPRSHELLVSSQTNYLPSSLSTRSLLSLCASTPTSTRARKPSIMLKLVRLSQGNHGINWTAWSRLVSGVYSLSLILSFSTSTRPGDTCVTAPSTPMCPPRSTTSLTSSLARTKSRKVS